MLWKKIEFKRIKSKYQILWVAQLRRRQGIMREEGRLKLHSSLCIFMQVHFNFSKRNSWTAKIDLTKPRNLITQAIF